MFEWDEAKNSFNQEKHGVYFETAQWAFDDPEQIIPRDLDHEKGDKRFFCFGKINGDVLTVRLASDVNGSGSMVRVIGD